MPAPASTSGGVQRVQPATSNPSTAQSTSTATPASTNPSRNLNQDWNAEDLQKVVLEYLTKKGFHKAETVLRLEASQMQEASTVGEGYRKWSDPFFGSTEESYELVRGFVEQSLDMFKGELSRILWPTFAYMFMDLLAEGKENPEKNEEGKSHFGMSGELTVQQRHFLRNIRRNMSCNIEMHSLSCRVYPYRNTWRRISGRNYTDRRSTD